MMLRLLTWRETMTVIQLRQEIASLIPLLPES